MQLGRLARSLLEQEDFELMKIKIRLSADREEPCYGN